MLFEIEEKCGVDSVIYYTADQHFGHSNIIRFCKRPFISIEEMDNALNAGVEINNYRPVILDELILNNRKFVMG